VLLGGFEAAIPVGERPLGYPLLLAFITAPFYLHSMLIGFVFSKNKQHFPKHNQTTDVCNDDVTCLLEVRIDFVYIIRSTSA
jgi:hypothetical protein